jgi:hypothetical protein
MFLSRSPSSSSSSSCGGGGEETGSTCHFAKKLLEWSEIPKLHNKQHPASCLPEKVQGECMNCVWECRTAEKKGINWSKMADEVLTSDVYAEKELLEDKSLVYPDCKWKQFLLTAMSDDMQRCGFAFLLWTMKEQTHAKCLLRSRPKVLTCVVHVKLQNSFTALQLQSAVLWCVFGSCQLQMCYHTQWYHALHHRFDCKLQTCLKHWRCWMLLLMLSNGGSSVSRLLERVPCVCRWQSLLEGVYLLSFD